MLKAICLKTGKTVDVKVGFYKQHRAVAYAAGAMNQPFSSKYDFEVDAWQEGRSDDERLRETLLRMNNALQD